MAEHMLAVSSRQNNPILDISSLINESLLNMCANSDRFYLDYNELSTLIGLSLTAIMAEGTQVDVCKTHFETFLRYRYFPKQKLEEVSIAISEIIHHGLHSFKTLGFPRYYDDFIWSLHRTLSSFSTTPIRIKQKLYQIFEQYCSI